MGAHTCAGLARFVDRAEEISRHAHAGAAEVELLKEVMPAAFATIEKLWRAVCPYDCHASLRKLVSVLVESPGLGRCDIAAQTITNALTFDKHATHVSGS